MPELALGLVLTALAVAFVVYFRPRNAVPHPLIVRPGLDTALPMAWLVTLLAGVALIVQGLAG